MVKVYEEGGIAYREDECPEGWVKLAEWCCSSLPDHYGITWQLEIRAALVERGVESRLYRTERSVLHPRGRRFGDGMLNSVYRVAVREGDLLLAKAVLEEHEEAKRQWLHKDGVKPKAIR